MPDDFPFPVRRRLLESEIERPAKEYAEKRGWLVRKLKWLSKNGAPDDFFARDGVIKLVEFKRPDEKLKTHQVLEIAELRLAGVIVEFCDSMETAYRIFR